VIKNNNFFTKNLNTYKMKTKIPMLVALFFTITISAFAQQGGWQRQTVEERVKSAMDKMNTSLNLNSAEQSKTAAVFTDFFTSQDKMREEARSSGTRMDRSVYQKMMDDRDAKLKTIFTDDQY
jgi:hypothetical protein